MLNSVITGRTEGVTEEIEGLVFPLTDGEADETDAGLGIVVGLGTA